jgi:hypothetical protein
MSVERDASLKRPEERGRAEALESEFCSSNMKDLFFHIIIVMRCFLSFCCWTNLFCFLFFLIPKGKKSMNWRPPNNFVYAQTLFQTFLVNWWALLFNYFSSCGSRYFVERWRNRDLWECLVNVFGCDLSAIYSSYEWDGYLVGVFRVWQTFLSSWIH